MAAQPGLRAALRAEGRRGGGRRQPGGGATGGRRLRPGCQRRLARSAPAQGLGLPEEAPRGRGARPAPSSSVSAAAASFSSSSCSSWAEPLEKRDGGEAGAAADDHPRRHPTGTQEKSTTSQPAAPTHPILLAGSRAPCTQGREPLPPARCPKGKCSSISLPQPIIPPSDL